DKHGVATTVKDARRLTLSAIQKEAAPKSPVPAAPEPEDLLTPADMRQIINDFSVSPLISVIMPTYNTDPVLLRLAIQSVIGQVYENWELCIADDGSKKQETISVLNEYAVHPKIKIKLLNVNGGISAASNEAISLSSGEYLALFDHDDELTQDALFWMVKEINEHPEADIIYSDECQKDEEGNKSNYFLKPDWSPQLLYNMMYTGHLSVYRKAFLEQHVGFFRSEYDFSQDYDLALRASEHTDAVRHVARVLYYWRQTTGSASVGDKPYARQSNIRAVEDAVSRRQISARVLELPTANRLKIESLPGDRVSIIVPTDSYENLTATIDSIAAGTTYSNYEIVPVTNSGLIGKLKDKYPGLPLHFVAYDKPYNFSDKCNAGAADCNGSIVIFFNDDVRPLQTDWIENTIEYLYLPGVGGVSPKLIYEDDSIQYAGMVTGVRNLTGTSFHCYPRNSTAYINFPQLTREVSILSGACLAMHKEQFLNLGGFDAVNTPSAHSDVDLSFKIIEAGLRCIYTPYAELRHIGHLSLAGYEKKDKKKKKDRADIFLLQRWPEFVARDPYFPAPMRNLLYHDSPEPTTIFPGPKQSYNPNAKNVILVCHDLSRSGAPIMLYNIAKVLMNNGYFPVVFCTKDGPLRQMYQAAGITVIIDPLILSNHPSFERFAINFDYIICNTVVNWPIVRQMQDKVHTIWWLQEAGVMNHFLPDPAFVSTLRNARNIIGVSNYSLNMVKPYNSTYTKIYNACFDFYDPVKHDKKGGDRIVFTIVGSIESRKGHDILFKALRYLQPGDLDKLEIRVVGRILDPAFETMIRSTIVPTQKIIFVGEVDNAAAVAHVAESDVIVCPSRDDPFPVVLVEGFCMGKTCIVSDATGFAELITHGSDGFVFPSENAEALADIIGDIVSDNYDLAAIGDKAREVYLRELSIPVLESRLLGYLNRLPEDVALNAAISGSQASVTMNQ
ncbi:MAG: glycosyltransferase, partial [Chitinophagaceae bacterium]